MPSQLEIKGVSLAFGDVTIIQDVSLVLEQGVLGCLLGPSGCGKTTLLRAVAGFEPVATGEIRLQGRLVATPGLSVPPEQRRAGMVFQDFALFPHLSVERNVAFGLRHLGRRARQTRVGEILELVGMAGSGAQYPHQLSGGQQQRIAIARALANDPPIILADEPTGNLDSSSGEAIMEMLEELNASGRTVFVVSHDPRMTRFATQVVQMLDGHIDMQASAS